MNLIKKTYEFWAAAVLLICCSCTTETTFPIFVADRAQNVITAIVPAGNEYEILTLHIDKANLGDYTNERLTKKANKFVSPDGNIRYVINKKNLTKITSKGKPNKTYEFLSGGQAFGILGNAKQLMNAFETQYNLDYTEQKEIIDNLIGIIDSSN